MEQLTLWVYIYLAQWPGHRYEIFCPCTFLVKLTCLEDTEQYPSSNVINMLVVDNKPSDNSTST